MSLPAWMPGLELSRIFYEEAVAPVLARHFPGVRYAAGRLDTGSEVLGFDTERSMDHWWGPRLQLFLEPDEAADAIKRVMGEELPFEVRGFPTHLQVVDAAT